MKKGLLIVFSGPSGVGKDTILKELVKSNDSVRLSISATTRQKRAGEIDGKDYYFLSEEEFLNKVANGQMLEYAKYCSNYYGTPKEPVDAWLNDGLDVILEIEVQGGQKVINRYKDAVSVFILPLSLKVLEKRLRNRGTNSESEILQRLREAENEIRAAEKYKYAVVNDDIKTCVENINAIIKSEKLKLKNMLKFINGVLLNDKTID